MRRLDENDYEVIREQALKKVFAYHPGSYLEFIAPQAYLEYWMMVETQEYLGKLALTH